MVGNDSFRHAEVAATALEWARMANVTANFFDWKVSHCFCEVRVADDALVCDAGLAEGVTRCAHRGGTSQQILADWAV